MEKPEISYEDFAKLDIRIGTIIAVEVVPEADKLLRLLVEVGEAAGPRQIVSGIREYFPDPTVLLGKQAPFLVNLAPRTIKGLESQGMIIAAGEGDLFGLLTPHVSLPPGMIVR